jgi:Ca-activated chloride channel family protein
MTHEFDESRLTAYVLGELDENDRKAIEEQLQASPELRAEVEEIRRTVEFISGEFASEEPAVLTDTQRGEIESKAGMRRRFSFPMRYRWVAAAAAACLVFAVLLRWDASLVPDEPPPPPQLPQTSEPEISNLGAKATSQETTSNPSSIPDGPTSKAAGQNREQVAPTDEGLSRQPRISEPTDSADIRVAPPVKEDAELRGKIVDPTGGPIPGVSLSLEGNREKRKSETDEDGNFEIKGVEPGNYELEATMPGFKTLRQSVEMKPGEVLDVNPTLKIGELTEAVIITGPAPKRTFANAKGWSYTNAEGRGLAGTTQMPQIARDQAYRLAAGAIAADEALLPNPVAAPDFNTEAYDRIQDNPFIRVSQDPLSTFSIDVDTASYSNIRRFLNDRTLPPKDAVRIEELVNYFSYDYQPPTGSAPFAVHLETATAAWSPKHKLVRIALKGKEIPFEERKPTNLVFLLDVSGSMQPENKLPLLKRSLRLLVDKLGENDRVAMVVYAGASGLVLPSTSCSDKEKILEALDRLEAGGSTNGGSGIQLAYKVADENFIKGGINRVILATDGDFNVGVTNQGDLTRIIEEKAKSGVFLTVLGFGMGNFKDSNLEKLADKGNGNYGYVDSLQEARKLLVDQIGGTLITIAKDVKIQVEFNPAKVEAYRLIGYENRMLRHQDFNDDTKDAGEIGAGLTVTALYEVVPKGVEIDIPGVDPLKYQKAAEPTRPAASSSELLTVKLRYKEPDEDTSKLLEFPLKASGESFDQASTDFRFAASVASFGMVLRDSEYRGDASFDTVLTEAQGSLGPDTQGYRHEFINLVKKARAISELEAIK